MRDNSIELNIEKSGLLTLVQDRGRIGPQSFGVPTGGALDRRAAKTANWLVGQKEDDPVLEITLQGPQIRFEGDLQTAITGADLTPMVNGQEVPMYETLSVKKGQQLSFGAAGNGCRAYLAFGGQWQIPEWLDSYSAMQLGGAYWPPGSLLKKGSRLRILPNSFIPTRSVSQQEWPFHAHQITVRVIRGPEYDWFSEASISFLTSHAFTIHPDSNRMGYRLQEALPAYESKRELISSGVVPGTIQVLPSGRPVTLLADAQTSGGYPRIANVLDNDLDYLAQLVPGDKIRFLIQ